MANELDETDVSTMNENGRDVHVIEKKIPAKVGAGSVFFEVMLWVLAIIPGIVFTCMKIKARNYFRGLQQKINHDASQIDNYIEQRVVILQNVASLLDKAIDLDKETFTEIARLRSNSNSGDADEVRNEVGTAVDQVNRNINVTLENYPELKAHKEIADALQQNSYLQREITAARELYNDAVNEWNVAIFQWPTKAIVAARQGYTTRIPYSVSKDVKEAARQDFFAKK